jgi:hypothetical protein
MLVLFITTGKQFAPNWRTACLCRLVRFSFIMTLDFDTRFRTLPPAQQAYVTEYVERVAARYEEKARENQFIHYRRDPVKFGVEILGEEYTEDIIDVMYSVRDNPVTIARSATGVGKTFAAARIAVWWYLIYAESQVWATAAPPLENLKNLLWGEISTIINKRPDLFETSDITSLGIRKKAKDPRTKSKYGIYGVAIPTSGTSEERVGKFSGKHAPYLLFILDEGDAIPDEVYEGVDGCVSGGHTRILIMFNPKAKRGRVYNKEKAGQAYVVELSAFKHPNVWTGRDVIPGAVTRDATIKRINEWSRELVEDENINQVETFEVPNFLVGETAISDSGRLYPPLPSVTRVITDPQLSYKVLGKYPKQSESQLINEEWINNARDRYDEYIKRYGERSLPGLRPRLGVDIAEFGVDYNVCFRRYANLVMPPHRWSGLDPDATSDKVLEEFYYKYNAELALIDGIGIGSSVAPSMVRKDRKLRPGSDDPVRAISVKFSEKPSPVIQAEEGDFYQKRDQLWWAMREWLKHPENEAMLPPVKDLIEELQTATYSTDKHGGKITVMSKDEFRDMLKRSPNYADALALTFDPYRKPTIEKVSY